MTRRRDTLDSLTARCQTAHGLIRPAYTHLDKAGNTFTCQFGKCWLCKQYDCGEKQPKADACIPTWVDQLADMDSVPGPDCRPRPGWRTLSRHSSSFEECSGSCASWRLRSGSKSRGLQGQLFKQLPVSVEGRGVPHKLTASQTATGTSASCQWSAA